MCAYHYKITETLPQHGGEGEQSSSCEAGDADDGRFMTEAVLALPRPSMSPGKAMDGVPPKCQPEGTGWIIFCAFGPRRERRCGLEPSRLLMGGDAPSGGALSAIQLKTIAVKRESAYRAANIAPHNGAGDRGVSQGDQHRQKIMNYQEERLEEARLERRALANLESSKATLESLQGEMASLMQQRAQDLQVATDRNFPENVRSAAILNVAYTAAEHARLRVKVAELRTQLAEMSSEAPPTATLGI